MQTLYVHASALNLRVKPSASAAARARLPIGTACDVLVTRPDGWAELKCQGARGFARLELLGERAPDHGVYLKDGKDAARPLPERMNLLQRALALKPQDAATAAAFRETFYAAEFDRLQRARANRDTLKEPARHAWVEACDRTDPACVLLHGVGAEAAWNDARVQGDDVVLVLVFTDGLMRVVTAHREGDEVKEELRSESVPGPDVVAALGGSIPGDQCQPVAMPDGDPNGPGALCGYAYEQNCSPDDCWDGKQTCRETEAVACQECKLGCGTGCSTCRQACTGPNRRACVASCVARMEACAARCQKRVDNGYATCDVQYGQCASNAQAQWESECAAPCRKVHRCAGQGADAQQKAAACADRVGLPDVCRDTCLFGFQ